MLNRVIAVAIVAVGSLAVAILVVSIISTQQNPGDCNVNSVGLGQSAKVAGVIATVVEDGQAVTYTVALSIGAIPGGTTACNFDMGQLTITFPDLTICEVAGFAGTPVVPLITTANPFNSECSTEYIADCDVNTESLLEARVDYGGTTVRPLQTNGIYHASVRQQTATATASNALACVTPTSPS